MATFDDFYRRIGKVFGNMEDVIELQSKIIRELSQLLSEHLSAEEINRLPLSKDVEMVDRMINSIGGLRDGR